MPETKTVRVYIMVNEEYPCFDVSENAGGACRVSRERLKRWERVKAEYDKMQKELRKLNKFDERT